MYTTDPPMKYADAPGTARSAAEMSPPDDDSVMAMVSPRSLSIAPTSFASCCRGVGGMFFSLCLGGYGLWRDGTCRFLGLP